MSAFGLLLFLVGIWIILNTPNLVGVLNGDVSLGTLAKPNAHTPENDQNVPPNYDGKPKPTS